MVTKWALIVKIRIFAVNIQYFTRIQLYFDMNQAIQLQAHFGISVVYIIYGTKIKHETCNSTSAGDRYGCIKVPTHEF